MVIPNDLIARQVRHAMGTVMVHEAYGAYAEESLAAVCAEIERLEGLFSRFLPESEISQINRAAGGRPVKIGFETYEVLERAVAFSRACPGLLDITISPLVDLWGIGRDVFSLPSTAQINETLSLVDYRGLVLNSTKQTAGLSRAGQSIDLGGIAKGYAADKVLEVYRTFGIVSAYSNLGGNVVTLGTKPDGSPWKIGVQHPRLAEHLIGAVSVVGQSVVTSGDYQRYVTGSDGQRYHHILDPQTGYPAKSGLASVTIVTEESVEADALSTMVFIAGLEKGCDLLSGYPQADAILVDTEMKVYITHGLKNRFQAGQDIRVNVLN